MYTIIYNGAGCKTQMLQIHIGAATLEEIYQILEKRFDIDKCLVHFILKGNVENIL